MNIREFLAGYPKTSELTFKTYWKGRGKKRRLIAVPSLELARLQREFVALIQEQYNSRFGGNYEKFMINATGAVPGFSPLLNAQRHERARHFYLLDFSKAFESVQASRLAKVLRNTLITRMIDSELGTHEEVADFLERFFMISGHGLAQGAPASPLLFNIYAHWEVDRRIGRMFYEGGGHEITYTRYVDDLTFSSDSPIPSTLRRKIRAIITTAGFTINHRKSQVLEKGRHRIEITGVHLLPDGHWLPKASFLENLERELDAWLISGEGDVEKIAGSIAHFESIRSMSWGQRPNRLQHRLLRKTAEFENRTRVPRKKQKIFFTRRELDDLRANTSLVDGIGETVKLKRSGEWEWIGLCPFHKERTPSFTVSKVKGFFHCFGCGAHGDIISFVMKTHHVDFVRAVRYLQTRQKRADESGRLL